MIRKTLAALIFAAPVIVLGAKEPTRYYVLPKKVFDIASKKHILNVVQKGEEFTMIRSNADLIEPVGHAVHNIGGSCGGYWDVTDLVAEKSFASFDFDQFKARNTAKNFAEGFANRKIKYKGMIQDKLGLVQQSRFQNSLDQLTQFPNRSARSRDGARASKWLKEQAMSYAKAVGRTDVTSEIIDSRSYRQSSVVIRVPGTAHSKAVVIGGHMDTLGRQMPGADDDGTGTISVLEIFRAILDSELRFKNDMYFAFYAAEEVGLVGSRYVVQTFKERNIQVGGVFHLDMTGFNSSREDYMMHFIMDYTDGGLTKFTKKLATQVIGVPANKIGETRCNYACSDHANWNRQGYPVAYPFEASFNNYNRDIHTNRDTIANIDFEHAMRFARLGFAFMTELGEPVSAIGLN